MDGYDVKEIVFGLFRSRKFRIVLIGFLVALAVRKGWLGEMDEAMQADLINYLVWGVGALVGATALEDAASKTNLINVGPEPTPSSPDNDPKAKDEDGAVG